MRQRTSILCAALAAVTFTATGLVLADPVQADDGAVTHVALSTDTTFTPTSSAYLITESITLVSGERRHIRGHLSATSSTTVNADQVDEVRCLNSAGAVVGVAAVSSRNHEGSDAGYPNGELALDADLLFTAPSAGTYRCQLIAETASSASQTYYQTAIAAHSYLEFSATDQAGANWWQNPACGNVGTDSTCTYIGPNGTGGQTSSYVFYNDGTPVYDFPAIPSAHYLDAYTHVELTTCYQNTNSCPSTRWGTSGNSVVTTRIDLIQLDSTLHTCKLNQSTTLTSTISNAAHHYSINMSMTSVPILSTCGTRLFILRVYTAWVSGNTVKIDGSNTTTAQTTGILINKS